MQSTGTNIQHTSCVQCLELSEQDYFWCNTKRLNVELGQERDMTLLLGILIVFMTGNEWCLIFSLSGAYDQMYQVTELSY